MMKLIIGIFIILHGLVHLFYFGQSQRLFELQPGMVWPDSSWAFFRITGKKTVRLLASIACILAAIGFVVGGVAILLSLAWWTPVILGSAVFSSGIFLLFWDKEWHKLVDKGLIGILINMATLVVVLLFQWPDFDF